MPANKYAAPSSSSQRIAPVPRVCQAYARCATPLIVNNHPNRTVTAIPAIGGMMTARMPAMIITTLSAMTHPKDFLSSVDGAIVVVLMLNPPSIYKDRISRCKNHGARDRSSKILISSWRRRAISCLHEDLARDDLACCIVNLQWAAYRRINQLDANGARWPGCGRIG